MSDRHTLEADILIIGGGLSGSLLAAQLLRQPIGRRLVIVEPRADLGRGEAYSAVELGHTLNANAARMSVDPDNPDDLSQWLEQHIAAGGWPESAEQGLPAAELFPPRSLFGRYARQRLAQAQAAAALHGSELLHLCTEAVDVQLEARGVRVWMADGSRCLADRVILATGMFTAARTSQREGNGLNTLAVDPWDVATMGGLDPDGRVLIIGSGLTMIDALVSLNQAGHRGPVEVFSRHGLLPHVRRQPPAWEDFLAADTDLRSPLQLFRALRAQCRLAESRGIDWQAPLDTVRAHIGRLWSQATDVQRRQFVRHVRPFWESHHHRAPPLGAALLERWLVQDRLRIRAATLLAVARDADGLPKVQVRSRGEAQSEWRSGCAVINSMGIEYDWRRVDRPLPRQLLARELVRPGPLALGIAADPNGAVIDAHGQVSQRLFTLGPPLRGQWWESTAVTDVAAQAKALARYLLASSRAAGP
ncbi:NAD(P)-binding protein [Pseudomonas capeferrum]|uniref:FAD/NAD(P)-binding protein n=1 Tax=Pseudomonas capeferrum TaxID=1495066 RepID=UPI0015E3D0EA|nr:FAD/NAD(P)-binding protein [Pseudomonas capeferrum]MBA1204584.1 NAD(P)-binding protein [Pseudomonas capeferrum]